MSWCCTWRPPAGSHVESIIKASFTDVPLPAFLEQDRKRNVEKRAWFYSSILVEGGLFKIPMWGFQEMGDGRDSCMRTWVQSDVGLFTQDLVKVLICSFPHVSELLFTPTAVWLLNPHNLPPAVNDWGYWLPVHWAHQLDLVIINLWLHVDINLSEIIKCSTL